MADLAEARRALEAFSGSVNSASSGSGGGDAGAEVEKLQRTLVSANDNVEQLQKSFTSMSGAATGSLSKAWSGVAQLSATVDAATAQTTALAGATATAAGGVDQLGNAADKAGDHLKDTNGDAGKLTQTGKGLQGQLGNITAQFNDIAVQLAGGQSPFQIALQQGTQLSQIFSGQGLTGVIEGLGEAFASLASPVDLLIIATIALGGYALQYFMDLAFGSQEAVRTLKEQEELIRDVAGAWGAAVPALQAYVDQLDRVKTVSDAITAANDFTNINFAPVRKELEDLNVQFADTIATLGMLDGSSEQIGKLQNAWEKVTDATKQGRVDAEAMLEVQNALASAIAQFGVPSLEKFGDAFDALADRIRNAAETAAEGQKQLVTALAGGDNVQDIVGNSTFRGADGKTYSQGAVVPYGDIPTPEDRPSTESMYAGGTWNKPKKSGVSKGERDAARQAKDYKALITSTQQYIEKQQLLAQTLGMTDLQAAKLTASQKLFNDAQSKGIKLTPEQTTQLQGLADQMANAEVQMKNLREAYDFGKDTFKGFFTDLKTNLADGEGLWKSFGDSAVDALGRIGDKILDSALDGIFDSLWKGGGSGVLSGFMSLFGGHATGTAYSSGGWKMVGEKGPELMRVPGGSQVIPNNRISAPGTPTFAGAANQNNGGVTIVQHLHANGDESIKKIAYDATRDALDQYDTHQLPQSIDRVASNPRMR
jgi:hypothetical protein